MPDDVPPTASVMIVRDEYALSLTDRLRTLFGRPLRLQLPVAVWMDDGRLVMKAAPGAAISVDRFFSKPALSPRAEHAEAPSAA